MPDQELFLEVELNRQASGGLHRFELRAGRLWASAGTLRALGLQWPGQELLPDEQQLALNSLPLMQLEFDMAQQRLRLMVPVEFLGSEPTLLGYRPPEPAPDMAAEQAPGLLLNYEMYGQSERGRHSAALWNELRLFGLGPGIWRSSQVLQWRKSWLGDGGRWQSTRLDSSWQLDLPETMLSLSVGDNYSTALDWTRSLRFQGIRLARNFQLQPYRATVPLARYAGEAALPSVVDLYINGIREAQSEVRPGRFQVQAAPVLNGAGQAQVVVTDITGQSRVLEFPIYSSTRLLQAGLSDWSLELGRLRKVSGLETESSAQAGFAAGTLRYGLSRRQVLELHAQAGARLWMAGLGGAWLLGQQAGVLTGSAALSREGGLRGGQRGLGYEWQSGAFSLKGATLRRDPQFRDMAALNAGPLPPRTEQIFLGWALGAAQFGASFVRQDSSNTQHSRFLGLSWSQSLGAYGFANLSLNRELGAGHGFSSYLYWSLPLERLLHGWLSHEHQARGDGVRAGLMRPLPADGPGWGWRLQAGAGENAGGNAELSRSTPYGQWRLGLERYRSTVGEQQAASTVYADAVGALLLMQGQLFPMRRAHDAFALVSTEGIADVPVLLENRPMGKTDARGLLLLPQLNAWQRNLVAIDPLALGAEISVQDVERQAVPAGGRGVLLRFGMKKSLNLLIALQGPQGDWVPAGTALRLQPRGGKAIVGYEGQVFLLDPEPGSLIVVEGGSQACSARLPTRLPASGHIQLGVLRCE